MKTFVRFAFCLFLAAQASHLTAESSFRQYDLQWAILQGVPSYSNSASPTPTNSSGVISSLLEWDLRRGNDTLSHLFRSDALGSMQQGDHYFSGDASTLAVYAGQLSNPVEIDLSISIELLKQQWRSTQVSKASIVIRSAGKVISKRTVKTEIGQKTVFSTQGSLNQPPVYVVIQIDPVDR